MRFVEELKADSLAYRVQIICLWPLRAFSQGCRLRLLAKAAASGGDLKVGFISCNSGSVVLCFNLKIGCGVQARGATVGGFLAGEGISAFAALPYHGFGAVEGAFQLHIGQ